MKDKFVIVDGSSMLSTCYYAVLPREIMFAKTEEEKQKQAEETVQIYKADGLKEISYEDSEGKTMEFQKEIGRAHV